MSQNCTTVDAVLPEDVPGEDGNIGQMPAGCLSLLETRSGDGVFTITKSVSLYTLTNLTAWLYIHGIPMRNPAECYGLALG